MSLFNQDSQKNMKNTLKESTKALDIQALIQEVLPKPPQLESGGASALPKPSWSNLMVRLDWGGVE